MLEYADTAANLGMTLEHFSTVSALMGLLMSSIVVYAMLKSID